MSTGSESVVPHGALHRFGLWLVRHAKSVLIVSGLLLLAAAALGTTAFGKLQAGGFEDPGSESERAGSLAAAHFPPEANLLVLVEPRSVALTDPSVTAQGQALTAELDAADGVAVTGSWFTTPIPDLTAADGSSALILVVVEGDQGQAVTRAAELSTEISGTRGPLEIRVGGALGVFGDINNHVGTSLVVAESIAIPITLLLLLVVFGSVVAALLPLLIGITAIVGTFALLAVLGGLTDVSVFAINLTTALGLGLGIDYGLLLVARFREQLASGQSVPDAVARTVATAGRTILFSAAAVMAALATLLVFPIYFLSSFGYAGIGVVLIAAAAALVITPAALGLLGHRVDKGKVPLLNRRRGRDGAVDASASRFWGKVAATVFRRPLLTATPVLALLLLVASPLLGIGFALPDQTVLPEDAESRSVATVLQQQYEGLSAATFLVVSDGPVAPGEATAAAQGLLVLSGVTAVETSTGIVTPAGTLPLPPTAGVLSADGFERLRVHTDAEAGSTRSTDLVGSVRATLPDGFLVGGVDPSLADTLSASGRPLPVALGIVVVTTFILLFLFTGSVLQPIRALVVNSLSLAAALGITTWVFQDGNLIGLFGATARPMDASMTVLLLCIAFGLSMDYEVFLASRITELHHGGADLRTAVVSGLARTGRIVTSAAVLLAVSFFAFTASSVSLLQLFGLGAGLAVLIDATLVRGVLVPAIMRVLGRANFWAPRWLQRVHAKVGLKED